MRKFGHSELAKRRGPKDFVRPPMEEPCGASRLVHDQQSNAEGTNKVPLKKHYEELGQLARVWSKHGYQPCQNLFA